MRLSRRDLLISAGGLLAGAIMSGCSARTTRLEGRAFGSSVRLLSATPFDERVVRGSIAAVVGCVDQSMSPFRAGSEIGRFNRAETTDWQALSPDVLLVLREGLRVAEMTTDAFNPTVGPVVGRFGFGPITGRESGRSSDIVVGRDSARKLHPELTLDLCGIAKGHALDRIVSVCTTLGLTDFMVELGGEVYAQGRHSTGRSWHVGVERPVAAEPGLQRVVAIDRMALATSGIAVNGYRYAGRLYSHIIDPLTHAPSDTALASVTVVADEAMTADALATALFAMGPERGPAFAEGGAIEALFLTNEGGHVRETATAGFERRMLG